MKYLLDTCVLLWALEGNTKKIQRFTPLIEDTANHVVVSVVSYWEIVIKKSLGKLEVPDHLMQIVVDAGFVWLPLECKHVQQLEKLPQLHQDPFDRLLIAQAQIEQCELLTLDKTVLKYL